MWVFNVDNVNNYEEISNLSTIFRIFNVNKLKTPFSRFSTFFCFFVHFAIRHFPIGELLTIFPVLLFCKLSVNLPYYTQIPHYCHTFSHN